MRLVNLAAICAAAMTLSACALTEDTITLAYQSAAPAAAVAGADAVTVDVTVTDARLNNRDRVSVKKNGYGMEMAAIRSTNEPAAFIADAIKQELTARGFKAGAGGKVVKANLTRFYNDFKIGAFSGDAAADVNLDVQVVDGAGNVLYATSVLGQGTLEGILLADGTNAGEALTMSASNALQKIFYDQKFIDALLQQPAAPAKPKGKPTS